MGIRDQLQEFIDRHDRLFVLTGAGCSTESGIPDYRDAEGKWKRAQPVTYQAFIAAYSTRQRYWARSLVGWKRFCQAVPNDAHRALARLEMLGKCEILLTQNVDRLHQAAGSTEVIDLHGRLDLVRCMNCAQTLHREDLQQQLIQLNPEWGRLDAKEAPDGDADLDDQMNYATFAVPACQRCGGPFKPDVVFYGESVPYARVESAKRHLRNADAVLVVGSSLMVYSGFRFVQAASAAGKPIAAVNLGSTRADPLLALKIVEPVADALRFLVDSMHATITSSKTPADATGQPTSMIRRNSSAQPH